MRATARLRSARPRRADVQFASAVGGVQWRSGTARAVPKLGLAHAREAHPDPPKSTLRREYYYHVIDDLVSEARR
eukprot:5014004-Prymnesium_polylepis.1